MLRHKITVAFWKGFVIRKKNSYNHFLWLYNTKQQQTFNISEKSFSGLYSISFYRGSASDNWRNDSLQTNGFQCRGQKAETNKYYSERNGFRSDRNDFRNDRSSPVNESSGFGGAWSRGRGRFNSSRGSSTDRSFDNSPAREPLRIEVSNDYIGKVIG